MSVYAESFIQNFSVLYSPLKRHLMGSAVAHFPAQHLITEVTTDTFWEVVLRTQVAAGTASRDAPGWEEREGCRLSGLSHRPQTPLNPFLLPLHSGRSATVLHPMVRLLSIPQSCLHPACSPPAVRYSHGGKVGACLHLSQPFLSPLAGRSSLEAVSLVWD